MTTPSPTRNTTAINAVARETLHRIASERISPTPEAYARIYAQIAATHPDHPGTVAAPATNHTFDGKASAGLIARLLTQLDVHHAGITITRKREGLKRALVPRMEPLEALFARLNRLMDSWNGPNADTGDHVNAFLGTDIMGAGGDPASGGDAGAASTAALSASQVFTPPAQLFTAADAPSAPLRDARSAAASVRTAASSSELSERMISFRLAGLLALLLKNIDDLTPESALLGNQIEQIGRVLTAPLTEKKLDETERCLRALIVRQGAIKHSIDETKRAVRDLAESLLERLASLVNSTDSYAVRVVDMAEQIAATDDLGKLSTLTKTLVADTRLMSSSVAAERALLLESQERVKALEQQTLTLETELREASTLVRTDPLTRAMNRRGFADAFRAELTRSEGQALPSIALIDVDNFQAHQRGTRPLDRRRGPLQRGRGPPSLRRAVQCRGAPRWRGIRADVPRQVGRGNAARDRPHATRAGRTPRRRVVASAAGHVLGRRRAGQGRRDARGSHHASRPGIAARQGRRQELHLRRDERRRDDARLSRALRGAHHAPLPGISPDHRRVVTRVDRIAPPK